MSDETWLHGLNTLLSDSAATEGELSEIRNLLFGCHQLLQHGGHRVDTRFEALSEFELSEHAVAWAEAITGGAFAAPDVEDLDAGVRIAANLLRALEMSLMALGQAGRAPRSTRGLEVRYGDAEGWLLPFAHRFRGDPKDWPPYFAKRGLTKFRCIARTLVSGLAVDLKLIDAEIGPAITGAACLFEGLHLLDQHGVVINDETKGPFVVTKIADRDPKTLRAALEACCEPGRVVDVVIFPELAINLDEQKELSQLLRLRPWDEANTGPRPRLVVAGSWHHQASGGGTYRNSAPVLGPGGAVVGRHDKHMVFGTPNMREAIVAGDHILVLASRSLTVAIAICLDFCQSARPNPYDELDVDLVLVTSLANEKTVGEHEAQANRIWAKRKTATFLGQQSDADGYGFSGACPDAKSKFAEPAHLPVVYRTFTFTP